jgi:DNA phosphorothioation-dependent restriction protein DptH
MPIVNQALAEEISRLADQEVAPVDIARQLGLKRNQVVAILAHRKIQQEVGTHLESTEEDRPTLEIRSDTDEQELPAPPQRRPGVEETRVEAVQPDHEYGVLIGIDEEYDDPIFWRPQDARLVPNPHLMIMGESGSGKTYAVQCLMAELAQQGIPSVVFDYGQGFEAHTLEAVFSKYAAPEEYVLGEQGIALNPLEIFPADIHGPKSVATRVADMFDAVYQLGAIQRKVLLDAILRVFRAAGILSDDRATWKKPAPNLAALQDALEELAADKSYANARNAVGIAARLTTFFMLSSFRTDGAAWSWDTIISNQKHPVQILQFRGLEGKTQRILVEVLLWHLFFYLKSHGQGKLRLYCVLDEAHHLSFREGGPIDFLLREARKFGIGIIFASQQPTDFSPAAFSNSASKLVFQTTDTTLKVAKFLAAKCANFDSPEQIHELITSLPRGEALFISENRGHRVKISSLQQRSTSWSVQ